MVIWERFTTKKIVVNGREKFESRCEVWKYKWNTKWNILCVKIVALLAFTLLIAFIIYKNVTNSYDSEKRMRSLTKYQKIYYQTQRLNNGKQCEYQMCSEYESENYCCFTCTDVRIDAYVIDDIIGNHPDYVNNECANKVILKLVKCSYPKNKLVYNWSTIPISQLVINKNINDIEDGAFNSQILKNIKRITLQFPGIPHYRKNMLQGLSYLKWFEIQNSEPLTIEENFLKYVAPTITTLQITSSHLRDPITIQNLTSVKMPNLKDIDLQYNMLKSLPPQAFHNTPSLVAVYLMENSLPTLRETNFVSKIETLSIKNNEWICNCELYWLKRVKNLISVVNAKCQDGNQWKNFDTIFKMDCESTTSEIPPSSTALSEESSSVTIPHEESSSTSTTTTTITTITTTTTTTTEETGGEISSTPSKGTSSTITEEPDGEISLTPSEETPSTTTTSVTMPQEKSSSVTIPLEESSSTSTTTTTITITTNTTEETGGENSLTPSEETPSTTVTVKETDDGMVMPDEEKYLCRKNLVNDLLVYPKDGKLVVRYPGAKKNAKYFFFRSENIKDCNELSSSKGQVEGNFEPNTSYAFCELSSTNEMQCSYGRTLPLYENQTWLTNQNKIPVILIGIFVNLFSIVFSGVVTYFCMKKHSSFLQRNNNQPNFVMPSNPMYLTSPRTHMLASGLGNEELTLRRRAPFVPVREHSVAYVPVKDASYFSPVSDHYMYVRQTPTLHRSVSDISLKTVASYVPEYQIRSWRKRSKKERAPVTKLFDEPPPLPPPRNRCDVIVHENEILSQSSRQYW